VEDDEEEEAEDSDELLSSSLPCDRFRLDEEACRGGSGLADQRSLGT
jgi:hypothetical protein